MSPAYIVMPVLGNQAQTLAALLSAKKQTGVGHVHILAIDQGSPEPEYRNLESFARADQDWTVRVWRHHPPLPSLAATWNAGLDYAWASGADDALVINNDVELVPEYYCWLRERLQQDKLWFLSGIGVTEGQYRAFAAGGYGDQYDHMQEAFQLHPDFSAFLITRQCHEASRFDEAYVPAYCEDVDYHRRLLLGGQGQKIGKINLPFLHHAAGTLKALDTPERAQREALIHAGSRTHHLRKWKGPVNQERAIVPFGEPMPFDVGMDVLRSWAEKDMDVQKQLYRHACEVAASEPDYGPDHREDQPALWEDEDEDSDGEADGA